MLNLETTQAPNAQRNRASSSLNRILKYTLVRGVTLIITVVIGVYLTILIANGGGYVDEMRKGQIREQISMEMAADPEMAFLTLQQRKELEEERVRIRIEQVGLDRPFLVRSFEYLWNGLTLNLGSAQYLLSDSGSRQVRNILGERLAPTLLLMASGQLLLFFSGVSVALFLSRRYGSALDKFIIAMAPTSSAPAWFYGIFLILIFAAVLGWLLWRHGDAPPTDHCCAPSIGKQHDPSSVGSADRLDLSTPTLVDVLGFIPVRTMWKMAKVEGHPIEPLNAVMCCVQHSHHSYQLCPYPDYALGWLSY